MASSTYLQLVNQILVQANEVELTDSSFAGARGIHAAAKKGVRNAIRRINTMKVQWPFNNLTGSQVLTAGQELYTWPVLWKDVDWDSFYIVADGTLSTTTRPLGFVSKDIYYRTQKARDLDAGATGLRRPEFVFEANNGGFGVSPSPDAAYTVEFFYSTNDIDLETYDDVTTIPDLYDWVIESGAMIDIYKFYDNVARADQQDKEFKVAMDFMATNLIPSSPSVTARVVNNGGGAKYSRLSMTGFLQGQ
jgi:hypothetical protein